MLNVSVDDSGFDAALAAMIENLREFPSPMADEFADWQTDDVNRKNADVRWWSPKEIYTIFLPRGKPMIGKRFYRGKPGPPQPRRRPGGGGRPILRPFLFMRLWAREADLMERLLKWR